MDNFTLVSSVGVMMFCLEDEEMEVYNTYQRRSHRYWMAPYLKDRSNPFQRNTLAKLERDFLRLGTVDEFRATLRMPPEVYKELIDLISPIIIRQNTNYRLSVSPEERLSMTIRYLALGDSTRTLHHSYLVGYSTVQPMIRDTCRAIYSVLHKEYLKTPSTSEEWQTVADGFYQRWNMPHVLGAVDGKHIRIRCPRNSGSLFYNYKNYFSLVMMAVVDYDYRFIFVDIGSEGRASDSRVWRETQFFQDIPGDANVLNLPKPAPITGIKDDVPFYFVGDDAFAMGPHLMKPYPSTALDFQQRIFNYRLSRCQRIVENGFGILASRFRLFLRMQDMEPEGVKVLLMTAVVLHNYLRTKCGASYMPKASIDQEDHQHLTVEGNWRTEQQLDPVVGHQMSRNTSAYVKNMRNNLARWCISKHGQVPWQYQIVQGGDNN